MEVYIFKGNKPRESSYFLEEIDYSSPPQEMDDLYVKVSDIPQIIKESWKLKRKPTQVIEMTPIGKPRRNYNEKAWRRPAAVDRYLAFKDELLWGFKGELSETLDVEYHLPMAKSWSKKKKIERLDRLHQQTPDLDNINKAILDSLLGENEGRNDSRVAVIHATKRWSEVGKIVFY